MARIYIVKSDHDDTAATFKTLFNNSKIFFFSFPNRSRKKKCATMFNLFFVLRITMFSNGANDSDCGSGHERNTQHTIRTVRVTGTSEQQFYTKHEKLTKVM